MLYITYSTPHTRYHIPHTWHNILYTTFHLTHTTYHCHIPMTRYHFKHTRHHIPHTTSKCQMSDNLSFCVSDTLPLLLGGLPSCFLSLVILSAHFEKVSGLPCAKTVGLYFSLGLLKRPCLSFYCIMFFSSFISFNKVALGFTKVWQKLGYCLAA